MLKEITIPDNYTGKLHEENQIVADINNALIEIENKIQNIPDEQMIFEKHITDFENYEISAYFSENKKSVVIGIDNDIISLKFGDTIIRLDADGNIIQ